VKPRVAICGSQVPFVSGGAELLYGTLRDELCRRGFEAEIVTLPFSWRSHEALLQSAFAWRLVDLEEAGGRPVDLVIATRFPSYLVRHRRKVVWLIHQLRQAYELLGTPYSGFADTPEDRRTVAMVRGVDRRALGEARALFAISGNTAARLARFNGLEATPLHPPPPLGERYRQEAHGETVFTAGRLDPMKRFDLLIRALARTRHPVRAVVAGEGPQRERLVALAGELGLAARVELPGRLAEEELLAGYARALAVFYAPFDEDYGYVTVEAFRSARPVVTTADAGGVLEFVADGENGFVLPPHDLDGIAAALDRLWEDRALARRLGAAGRERTAGLTWDGVIAALTAGL